MSSAEKPATPSAEELKAMRKMVHDTYADMMKKKAADKAQRAVSEATGLSPEQAAKQLANASTGSQVS